MSAHSRAPVVPASSVVNWRDRRPGWLSSHSSAPSRQERDLEELENSLRRITAVLEDLHGMPHLGNWADPTVEFVYIILSRKTAERAFQPSFEVLRAVGTWSEVAEMSEADLTARIYGCGLEQKKAAAVLVGLRTIAFRFGVPDLSKAKDLPDDELFALLASLQEVGPKSSRCVMLCSFGWSVFPADAHVGRVLARLGVLNRVGIDLCPMGHKLRQRVLEHAIPPDIRYSLHANLVAHGRAVCRACSPACHACALVAMCEHGREIMRGSGQAAVVFARDGKGASRGRTSMADTSRPSRRTGRLR